MTNDQVGSPFSRRNFLQASSAALAYGMLSEPLAGPGGSRTGRVSRRRRPYQRQRESAGALQGCARCRYRYHARGRTLPLQPHRGIGQDLCRPAGTQARVRHAVPRLDAGTLLHRCGFHFAQGELSSTANPATKPARAPPKPWVRVSSACRSPRPGRTT